MGRVQFCALILVWLISKGLFAQVYGETIVNWDFQNGIPLDWINESSDGISHWEYRGPSTEPDNTVCSRGTCGALSVPPESTTLDNGFVIFDSNYWDAAGESCLNSSGTGPAPGPHNAYLITNSVDLSTEDNVTLTFQHQYKLWPQNGGPFTVAVSVNQGEWIDVFTNVNNAQNSVGWATTNLNALVANQADVRFRFLFVGTWYYWCLDDITLFRPSQNDLIASSPKYTNFDQVEIQNLQYHAFPADFAFPFNFSANALNAGGAAQSGVQLNIQVLNEAEEVLHSQLGETNTINPSLQSTLTGSSEYFPALPVGKYNIQYEVIQDQIDEAPEDNFLIEDFEITQYTYARDEGISDGNPYPPSQYEDAAFEIGNIFECNVAGYQLNSIAVALSDESEPGDMVYGIVYDFFRDTILAQTIEFPVNEAMLNHEGEGNWMIIPIDPPLILEDSTSYNVQVGSTGAENKIRVCASGKSPNESSYLIYPDINFLQFGTRTPMVRMQVFPVGTSAGCTDELAANYDPTAVEDDGSCQYPGCTNELANNYDEMANFDDGSCILLGCTDELAENYNPDATENDGSCLYPGCTNPIAYNYDPNANTDDGSCIIDGCTDMNASNFNPEATDDDGTCEYLGCLDEEANNYNPFALEDDGSCAYNEASFEILAIEDCAPVEITIQNLTGVVSSATCSFSINDEVIFEGCDESFTYIIENPGSFSIDYTYSVGSFSSSMSTENLEVLAYPELPELSFETPVLNCTGCAGYEITWYLNEEPIEGEIQESLTVTENGNYSVSVANELGCSVQTESIPIIVIGIENEFDDLGDLKIYPNPGDGLYFISTDRLGIYNLEIYNSNGAKVFEESSISHSRHQVDLRNMAEGIYTLRLFEGHKSFSTRLIKLN